jgi:hypothetical protein
MPPELFQTRRSRAMKNLFQSQKRREFRELVLAGALMILLLATLI